MRSVLAFSSLVASCHALQLMQPASTRWVAPRRALVAVRSDLDQEILAAGEEVEPEVDLELNDGVDMTRQEILESLMEQEGDSEVLDVPTIDLEKENEQEGSEDMSVLKRGDWDGLDDPRDVPWRLKGEELVRGAVASVAGIKCYDVTWNQAELQVLLESETEGAGVGIDDIVLANQAIQAALEPHEDELEILSRHELEVGTPGAKEILTAEREFKAFKGFEVVVTPDTIPGMKERDPIRGTLVGRDVHETVVSVKGRQVKIPNHLVKEVRLPDAKYEEEDKKRMKKKKQKDADEAMKELQEDEKRDGPYNTGKEREVPMAMESDEEVVEE